MSASPSNPFVLPGFGQSGDAATNPLFASLEMMRQAFAGLGGPAGMTGGLGLSPSMKPEELERKIAELKSVENWLKLNLSMLSSTIQGMEVQLATIATLKSFMAASTAGGASAQASGAQPAPPSWFSGWPTAAAQPQSNPSMHTQSESQPQPKPESKPDAAAPDPAERENRARRAAQATQGDAATAAVAPAAQAWWDMLQQQFGQVAAATAASMAVKPTQAAGQAPAKPARTPKKTTAPDTKQAAANAVNKTKTKASTTATKTKTKARLQTTKKAATKPTAE